MGFFDGDIDGDIDGEKEFSFPISVSVPVNASVIANQNKLLIYGILFRNPARLKYCANLKCDKRGGTPPLMTIQEQANIAPPDIELESLRQRLYAVEQRNSRVETDKAWEQSKTRVTVIAVLTYCVAGVVLSAIGIKPYLVSALVPVSGYLVSTFTLPVLKNMWVRFVFARSE